MEQSAVEKVSRKVAKQFPEMKGRKPLIKSQSSGKKEMRFVLTYKANVELPGGRNLRRVVRVVADEKGKVIRMSTSK